MKYTLLLLSILAIASCKKQKCYTCTYQHTYAPAGQKPLTEQGPVCDKSEEQIREYEKNSSYSELILSDGNIVGRDDVTTSCK